MTRREQDELRALIWRAWPDRDDPAAMRGHADAIVRWFVDLPLQRHERGLVLLREAERTLAGIVEPGGAA